MNKFQDFGLLFFLIKRRLPDGGMEYLFKTFQPSENLSDDAIILHHQGLIEEDQEDLQMQQIHGINSYLNIQQLQTLKGVKLLTHNQKIIFGQIEFHLSKQINCQGYDKKVLKSIEVNGQNSLITLEVELVRQLKLICQGKEASNGIQRIKQINCFQQLCVFNVSLCEVKLGRMKGQNYIICGPF